MQSTLPIRGADQAIAEFPGTAAGKLIVLVAAAGLVAICAHISIPLYFTPVPITVQTFAVVLLGMTLGPVLGSSAMVVYLAEGAVGLPVFSPHGLGGVAQLLGPTGGYLLSYPFAAAAAGGVVKMVGDKSSRFAAAAVGGIAASVVTLTLGAAWLAHLLHLSPSNAWHMSIAPFLPGEALKIVAAAGIYSSFRGWQGRDGSSKLL